MNDKNLENTNSGDGLFHGRRIQHWQIIALYLVVYDVVAVSLSYLLALWLRFDLSFNLMIKENWQHVATWLHFAPFYAILCVFVFGLLRLYRSIWRFASFKELQRIIIATVITTGLHPVLTCLFFDRMPISYYLIGAFIQFGLILGIRFSYRLVLLLRANVAGDQRENTMIIGAGAAGTLILRELRRDNDLSEKVACIIDDNPNKWNRDIDGIPIVGGREKIHQACLKYDISKIYLAIPSASAKEKKKILDICRETDCELRTLPGMYQLMLGKVTVNSFRKVAVEDLLGREPVKMSSREVREYLAGKTVLITGGGGSIGSELCRQVAQVPGIGKLIIFDIYENNAYDIQLELRERHPELDLTVLIGSVRNLKRLEQVFSEHRPDVVFHAAAHKHVPLMEDSPCEAIKNNVVGTYNAAYAALKSGCQKFVLISTDKAVNPVNVMGASKRLCEMIVQMFARLTESGRADEIRPLLDEDEIMRPGAGSLPQPGEGGPASASTQFVAVRFGNVLGSNGSVIPIFEKQIAAGGPVTVTHPDIIRYFMTIPEAASLVITAATFGGGGRIFVLDMGTPVKIADLARNMIRLSGLTPDEDIRIVYSGLRPGEKLYEERLMDEEGLSRTENELINIGKPIPFDEGRFLNQLQALVAAAYADDPDIRSQIAAMVPTYKPAAQ